MPPLEVRHLEKTKRFGFHLKRLREGKGLSQQALADIANIGKTTVLRIENGRQSPTLEMLFSICEALEVPIVELMDYER
ncbi:helix-turn-helix domain-containing protein [Rufibacter hautae]|nr:helix-turn-helix transcriptional regulator [Rufibacter hautae]